MSGLDQIWKQLEDKIETLRTQNAALKAHNRQLEDEKKELQKAIDKISSEKKLEDQNNNLLNIAQHIKREQTSESELKEQINRYLTYLDQCIELLNK